MQYSSIKNKITHYLLLTVGTGILAFGLFNIHEQSQITEGGVLGVILLLNHWFKISPSISGIIIDLSCYLLAWKLFGSQFLKNALFASFSFSLWYSVWEKAGYMLPNFSNNPIIASILGALFVGISVGIVIRQGGAAGGDDVLALAISKAVKCKISQAYLVTDIIILLLSLSYIPFSKIFYSLITVILSSFIIDKVQSMGSKSTLQMA